MKTSSFVSNKISEFVKIAPTKPGIYMMLSKKNAVLYIGKAKNIKNRLKSYINPEIDRINLMTKQVDQVKFITTETEEQALMLEMSSIKSMKPKYNILLKDGKSFAKILITKDDFPAISKYRGKSDKNGFYFGPFPSSNNVSQMLDIIEKFFQIRTCSNTEFKNRQRPCMKYQIKRCTAPCVSKISQEKYNENVRDVIDFLNGKRSSIKSKLTQQMITESEELNFEKAAQIRDKISAIMNTNNNEEFQLNDTDNIDIIGVNISQNKMMLSVFVIRNGFHFGSHDILIDMNFESIEDSIYYAVYQFYLTNSTPELILCEYNISYKDTLSSILKTKIKTNPSQKKFQKMIAFANQNAKMQMEYKQNIQSSNEDFFLLIQKTFDISRKINRLELFDNSHISGKFAVGAMVSMTVNGFDKTNYRRYNFDQNINTMNDYEMMENMLTRRARKIIELKDQNKEIPDLWIIDGGIGHKTTVLKVLENTGLDIDFICVSKGIDRNAGNELFHTKTENNIEIPRTSDLMYFLQTIRDEVHRFAITSHRKKREKISKI